MIEEKAEEYPLSNRQLCDTFKPPLTDSSKLSVVAFYYYK